MRRIALSCLAAMSLGLLAGCAARTNHVAPTPALIKQIAIPVYPNATPWRATDTAESSLFGTRDAIAVQFLSKDHLPAIERYYASHLPKVAKRVAIPLGIVTTVEFQWFDKGGMKQAVIAEPARHSGADQFSVIILQSISYTLGKPTPSATPSGAPSGT